MWLNTQIETNLESTKAKLAKTNLESVMAQSVQCLLYKHKGPGSIPTPWKKSGVAVPACDSSARETDRQLSGAQWPEGPA